MITHLSNQVFFVGTPASPAPIVLFLDSASTTILILLLLGGFSVNRWKYFIFFFCIFCVFDCKKVFCSHLIYIENHSSLFWNYDDPHWNWIKSWSQTSLNYQQMLWQTKPAISFHIVMVTSHIGKQKRGDRRHLPQDDRTLHWFTVSHKILWGSHHFC